MRPRAAAGIILVLLVAAAAWGLARRRVAPPGDPMPLALSLPPTQEVELAVYFRAPGGRLPPDEDLLAAARSWIAAHVKEPLRAAVERHVGEGGIEIEVVERDELPLPFDDVFENGPGATGARKRFAEAGHAVLVESSGPLARPCVPLWAALGAARGIAGATGGLLYDPLTFRFAPDGSLKEDLPPDGEILITDHIVVPYSLREDGRAWVTTVGLTRFGLPNLECRDVPPHLAESVGTLLNVVARHLVDRVLARPDASRDLALEDEIALEGTGAALVRLAHTPMGPDGTEPFLTLLPPRRSPVEKGVWLHSLVMAREPREDRTVPRPAGDPALARAREEARSRLPEVKKRFLAGLAPGEALYVKHAFRGDGAVVEHMWVAVTSWKGEAIEGTLANDPRDIPALKGGQVVEIDEAAVDDWLLRRADDTREGGFSVEVLREETDDK
jgi:uncharacterized protein YegJ (DUF2314 family)